jgi:hypothetical protein
MAILKIYYAPKIESLLPYKPEATHWLPENAKQSTNEQDKQMYLPGNVVCTTKLTSLDMIETLIKTGLLKHEQVLWISCINPNMPLGYTFTSAGKTKTFYMLNRPQLQGVTK